MGKQRRSAKNNEVQFLEAALHNNGQAIMEGAKKKRWTEHDLRKVQPLNDRQKELFQCYGQGSQMCAHGSAGTGKTFLACYLAVRDVLDKRFMHKRIIIVRSAVPTREVGHLPGTLEEKMQQYETPYRDIFAELFGRASTYEDMKEAGLIEFMPTSFVRGVTWDDAVVVVDEVQNMTFHEINSIVTRLGENSRILLLGDYIQSDLITKRFDQTGIKELLKIVQHMNEFATIEFQEDDIVRSEFTKSWIKSCNKHLASA